MKRFCVFMLAVLILFTCIACKKETLPATQPGSAQTAAGETEQTVSGVSVRIPAAQYRLARTGPEGMTVGTALLPYSGGAVLTGSMFTGSADEPLRTEAAAYYTPERGWPERAFVPRLSGCGTRQLLSDASDGHPGQRAGKGRGMGAPEAPDHRAALRRTKPRRLAASTVRF